MCLSQLKLRSLSNNDSHHLTKKQEKKCRLRFVCLDHSGRQKSGVRRDVDIVTDSGSFSWTTVWHHSGEGRFHEQSYLGSDLESGFRDNMDLITQWQPKAGHSYVESIRLDAIQMLRKNKTK